MIFLTRLKVLLRQKGNIFWTFIFPLALGTFFYFGFGSLTSVTTIETITINIVEEVSYKVDDEFYTVVDSATLEDGSKLFNINKIDTLENAKKNYESLEIDNYIYYDEAYIYQTRDDAVSSSVIKTFLNEYQLFNVYLSKSLSKDSSLDVLELWNTYSNNMNIDYVENNSNDNSNAHVIFFYALISMMCMFGSLWGVGIIGDIRADRSNLGIRIASSPTKKSKLIINYFLASLLLQTLSGIVLIIYLRYILGVDFGNKELLVIFSSFLGGIAGISLGMLIAVIFKGSKDKVENISSMVGLVLSFLSGLMSYQVKNLVDKNLGIISKINPANSLTDSLYDLYYYDDYKKYLINITFLICVSLVFISVTIFKMRRQKYANI